MGDWVGDLVETLLGEEAVVPEWALWMFRSRMEGRQYSISKAVVVGVLDIDDRMLLGEEDWELPELEARERKVFDHMDVSLQDLDQYQT